MTFHRHDLVYLHDSNGVAFVDDGLPQTVRQRVLEMAAVGVPMTVCRQGTCPGVHVGQTVLLGQHKYRVACRLDAAQICRITPPICLSEILESFQTGIRLTLERFIEAATNVNYNVAVYGSYAQAHLSGQGLLHEQSDLDILLRYTGKPEQEAAACSHLLHLLSVLTTQLPMRLDGEIRVKGQDIAFQEWLQAKAGGQSLVLSKSLYRVEMVTLASLI